MQLNLQYMPKDWITWWTEFTFRHSDVPYWSGPGGVTPPLGNTGTPASLVCNSGSVAGGDQCANEGGVWFPDLRTASWCGAPASWSSSESHTVAAAARAGAVAHSTASRGAQSRGSAAAGVQSRRKSQPRRRRHGKLVRSL